MSATGKRYDGKEPYIFISYSHADRERVLAMVTAMNRGYRVWYDEHITAGEQWTETLANKIAGCQVFLLFSSDSYIASFAPDSQRQFCRLEFLYAQKTRRPMIPVLLDGTAFPEEMEFLIGNPQQMRPAPDETPDAFAAKLDSIPLFQPCRRAVTTDAAPLAEVVTRRHPTAPSEEFVGRQDIMRAIKDAFDAGETVVVLHGVGGIGKSEIARKMFQTYSADAGTIGWAMWRGTLKETFYGQFKPIQDINMDAHWEKAKQYMWTHGGSLRMFIDNADNITDEDEARLTAFGCRFLITSRQTEHSERVRKIKAQRLSLEECRTLYRRAYKNSHATDDVLNEIIKLAGRHTLAVRLLAKTQKATHLSAEALLDKLRNSGFDLAGKIRYRHNPEEDADNTTNEKGVFIDHMSRIFVLSRLQDVEDGAEALRVLQGMSLLAPNTPVAFGTLNKWLELDGDFDGLNCAIETGWLNETPDGVSIHAVIAAVVCKQAMPNEALIDALAGQLRLDMIPEETEVFTNRLPILAHAIALDKATGGALHTENYGSMLVQMGYLLAQQADYGNALAYLTKSAEILKETMGEEHRDTATSYNNIGGVYRAQGDYARALEYYQQALRILERVLGTEHPDTARSYNNIGFVYDSQGDYARALEYYQQALRIKEKVLGIDHPSTATSYNNIGFVYREQGDYARALEYYQQALRIDEKVLGTEHPDTATDYNNIGGVYDSQGDYARALEYYQQALRILERVLGTEHPATARSYNNIGALYFSKGDYSEALRWLKKAFMIFRDVLGPEHPNTKTTQAWLDATKRALSGEE